MKAPARLGLYGLTLVVVFALAAFTANMVVPEQAVQNWSADAADGEHAGEGHAPSSDGHDGEDTAAASLGLALEHGGYQLSVVAAPQITASVGDLSFVVTGPDGEPVTDFELDHEEEMHLIVVRSDGEHFRHVHPERDGAGTWSIPWEWDAAGSYRIFADFVPSGTAEGLTLSTSVEVAGDHDPTPAAPASSTTVDDFDVSVQGDLVPGEASELTMTVTRDGEPVTELEPYLGAFGHLVALRDGDLAYLHVHPHEEEPEAGGTSGPEVGFEATAPTPGRYLLYLDFQVDGQVHTAPMVIDTTGADAPEDRGDHENEHEESGDHDHEQ